MTLDFLSTLPLFADLSKADLDRLYALAETITLPAGKTIIRQGEPGDSMYILKEGQIEISKEAAGQEFLLAVRGPGEVIGEMSLLDRSPRTATVRTLQDSRLLKISQQNFQELLENSSSAALVILHTVTLRLRQNEALLHQHEKMASLGTMAAGLAHELNNPASAAHRSAALLEQALKTWDRAYASLYELALEPAQLEKLARLRSSLLQGAASQADLDPLLRSDLEGELQARLEAMGVESAWEYAPVLVSSGWDQAALEDAAAHFPADSTPVVVQWLVSGVSISQLLDEVQKSTARLSDIVKAIKSYSYLDQAPVQSVDVHAGLEDTLIILRQKIPPGVTVLRQFDQALPRIQAYAGELNQVWTNLIDNALDAMEGQGQLTLRTSRQGEQVMVEIGDSGPGIPAELQDRIFEPFFTTKGPGHGTGLGLHIVYNIIVEKHRGQITVNSRPGETWFQVTLKQQLDKP
jgi:signal transduction histidine kinase